MRHKILGYLFFLFIAPTVIIAQDKQQTLNEQIPGQLSLEDCIKYALKHQPALKQSYINEDIAHDNNLIGLSGWLPQVYGTAGYQHYYQKPVVFSPSFPNGIPSGLYNNSTPAITAGQTLFNTDVLLAARASKLNTEYAKQNTESVKIDLVSNVSKAFYNLLLTIQQINVYKDDTARLKKNQSDTYHQYMSGVADKVDYKQATISLNNSMAQLMAANEAAKSRYAALKQLMGYAKEEDFTVNYDTTRMMQEAYVDTTDAPDYSRRIEYQQLLTAKLIQRETTLYYQLGFIPSLSANYAYNATFQSDRFSDLYNKNYPNSYFGLSLSVPLFTGFRRLENIHKSKLVEKRTDWDIVNLKLAINTEFESALASYKSNYYNYKAQEDNVKLAREVYDIVKLQYREGIKTYLDVITAESFLSTSEINYLNALFQVLSSKIDLQKAKGDLLPNQ